MCILDVACGTGLLGLEVELWFFVVSSYQTLSAYFASFYLFFTCIQGVEYSTYEYILMVSRKFSDIKLSFLSVWIGTSYQFGI